VTANARAILLVGSLRVTHLIELGLDIQDIDYYDIPDIRILQLTVEANMLPPNHTAYRCM